MKITRSSNKRPSAIRSCSEAPIGSNPYSTCQDYIKQAIASLYSVAESDIRAQEAIANLTVILLDLQG